ncbi:MAG: SoxR reducing system RseC family protein [bacterium]|nr:SoxR reducing system RseC family protein [bacterium]MDD5755993.1 SoxR reducing system RseC family protein [bacterium]
MMLEEIGKVIKVEGTQATVAMDRHSACAHCGICIAGCNEKMEIIAENTIGSKVNDRVKVAVAGPFILKSAFIVYIIPLFGLVLGYLAGRYFGGEKLGVIFGLGVVALVLYGLHYYDRKIKKEHALIVHITEIL